MQPLLLLVALACATGEVAAAGLFLRPGGNFAQYAADHLEGGSGSSVALGLWWGATLDHEATVQVEKLPWKLVAQSAALGAEQQGEGDVRPWLATYRFYLGHSTHRLRPYFGACGGMARVSGRIETRLSGTAYAGNVERSTLTYGGMLGLTLAMGRIVSLDFGYRYLQIGDASYDTTLFQGTAGFTDEPGPEGRLGGLRTHVVSFALAIRL